MRIHAMIPTAPAKNMYHRQHASVSPSACELWTALLAKQEQVERWFSKQWQMTPPPFYASVDLRYSGFKLCPIDTNLFPGGFNNIDKSFHPQIVSAVRKAVDNISVGVHRILLIAESHTRNVHYLENLSALKTQITAAGFDVRIAMLDATESSELTTPSGQSLLFHVLQKKGRIVHVGDDAFLPDLIILNNDLSSEMPELLQEIDQPITPPPVLGWKQRLKSSHFRYYAKVAEDFAMHIGFDPWLIAPLFRNCGEVDFKNRIGGECLFSNIGALLTLIQKKYDEHGVMEKPYVVVKADSGSYGMGVLVIHQADEITALNRKQRTEMSKTKSGQKITRVIVQEGVHTVERAGSGQLTAETVCYHIDKYAIGGFYRANKNRKETDNLNAPGVSFVPFVLDSSGSDLLRHEDCYYLHTVVSRLAVLAAAHELAEHRPKY